MMEDLFAREQQIFEDAEKQLAEIKSGAQYDICAFELLIKEYGRILRQLRRVTKISDRTTVSLNASKLDLLEKVHCDGLTGIYNRRYMEETISSIIKSISRTGGMLSVLMIDIDFFKLYNDTYGHSVGDECLITIANTLVGGVSRTDDFTARYGGEEFVVVLPYANEDGARLMAEKLLKNVADRNIPHSKSEVAEHVTVSIGVTTGNVKHTHSVQDYIKRADEALYMSKRGGRNKYTFLNFEEGEDK